MNAETKMRVAIVVATGITFAASQLGYHVHSSTAVPPIAGMGCGLLIWETMIEERKKKRAGKTVRDQLEYYGSCAWAVAICFSMDLIPAKGGVGLLASLVLNFATDALISSSVSMVIATMFDNAALAYLLGSRAHTIDINGGELDMYLYVPGSVYFAIMAIMRIPALQGWAKELERYNYFAGFVMGIVLFTAVIELAPHIVEQKEVDKELTAAALACMFVGAPLLLLFLKRYAGEDEEDPMEAGRGRSVSAPQANQARKAPLPRAPARPHAQSSINLRPPAGGYMGIQF